MNPSGTGAGPSKAAPHVIEAAYFELTLDDGIAPGGGERELARIVETELMSVVDELFDERAPKDDTLLYDRLEVDLGSLVFSGSWGQARERLRERLDAALSRARPVSTAGKALGLSSARRQSPASADFDLVAHFLCFGALPPHTLIRGGRGLDVLLQEAARAEPRRLAALVRGQSEGGVVAARLARQFSDSVLEQVIGSLSMNSASVMLELIRRLKRIIPAFDAPAAWEGAVRTSSWVRLLKGVAAASPPPVSKLGRGLLDTAASSLGMSYTALVAELEARVAGSGDLSALIRQLALEAGVPPDKLSQREVDPGQQAAHQAAGLADELDRLHPEGLDGLLERLRLGSIRLASLCETLSAEGHHRLLDGLLEETERSTGTASRLRRSVRTYARRAADERAFYRQVLERLVGGELIDLEAIVAEGAGADEPVMEGHWEREDAPEKEDAAGGLDLYARAVARLGGAEPGPEGLAEVIEALARSHPDELHRLLDELRGGALRLAPSAVLSVTELRALVGALLSPSARAGETDRSQLALAVEEHAGRAADERAFYRLVLERLAGGELIDLEAIAAESAGADEPVMEGQREREDAPETEDAAGGRDLYARAVARLGGAEPGPEGLAELIEALARFHPDELHRLLDELRGGALRLAPSAALSSTELRALVHAMLSPSARAGETDRSQLALAVEEHAGRAADERAFYRLVLERLAGGELIDLEAIAAQSAGADKPVMEGQREREDAPETEDAAGGRDLHARAVARLSGAEPGPEGLAELIEALARFHPDELQGLLEELRSGALRLAPSAVLSATELRALVHAMLSPSARAGETDRSQLALAVEEHARRAADERSFYRQVLERLAGGELIDLEAIAAESAGADEAVMEGQREREDAPETENAAGGRDLYARVVARLGGAEPGPEGLAELIEALARFHPDELHRLLDELRGGALRFAPSAVLSATELRALVHAMLSPSARAGDTDRSQLARAVEEHARRAEDERAFYRQVFERLVGGELIDLEAIAAQSAGVDEPVMEGQREREEASETEDAAGGRDLHARVVARLGGAELIDLEVIAAQGAGVDEPVTEGQRERGDAPKAEDAAGGRDLHARVVARLSGAEPGPEGLAELIEALARSHPDELHRLLDELRGGALRLAPSAVLSVTELRALAGALLAPSARAGDTDRSQLARAVEEHARRAADERAFYRLVLERLVGGELIDLEAIVEHSGPADVRPTIPRRQVRGTEGDAEAPTSAAEWQEPGKGEAESVLQDYLQAGILPPGDGRARLVVLFQRLDEHAPRRLGDLLRRSLAGEAAVRRLVGLLPDRLLERALSALAPVARSRLQPYADAIADACRGEATGMGAELVARLKWQFCFRFLIGAGREPDLPLFVRGFADYLAAHSERLGREEVVHSIRRWLLEADAGGNEDTGPFIARLLASEGRTETRIEPGVPVEHAAGPDGDRFRELLEQGIRIANAGQVLAAPYLPRLFERLGLLDEGLFASPAAQERAVHLLQFMVDERVDAPEYELVLNKALCGLDVRELIDRGIEVSPREQGVIEGLLQGMVQNWKAIGKTSVRGLRESFLQRGGSLRHKADGWHLAVDPKPFDMLLDRIPWVFSTIKHPWMDEVIHVRWR